MVKCPYGSEIRGAQIRQPVLSTPIVALAGLLQPEPGKTGIRRQLAGNTVLGHRKIIIAVEDFPGLAIFHHVHFHGFLEKLADVEECRRKNSGAVSKKSGLRAISDIAPSFVINFLHHGRHWFWRRGVILFGHFTSSLNQFLIFEVLGGAKIERCSCLCSHEWIHEKAKQTKEPGYSFSDMLM